MTQLAHGDPVKAMAQLTDAEPKYYPTLPLRAQDLLAVVRDHSVGLRTTSPTVAWTHGTHDRFRTATLVGNMAYSVLGWAAPPPGFLGGMLPGSGGVGGGKQFIVLRHPWGVTESQGTEGESGELRRSCLEGVVAGETLDAMFWPPVEEVDRQGVFAVEVGVFKECFAGVGVAK
jgi:hypothetical protein